MGKIKKLIFKFYCRFIMGLSIPIILSGFFSKKTGKEYNVGFFDKFILIIKMIKNNIRIVSASSFLEHLIMATKILNTPKSQEGCIIECGSYKGGSTSNLSLVAALCKRSLEVFDSFEGLPEPSKEDKEHTLLDLKVVHTYSQGAWCGSLKEVKRNILRYGNIKSCNFNVGYFKDTLPKFQKKCVFIFLDVDLKKSLEVCIKYLWPLLQDGCFLFSHEAQHSEISFLFFDKEWWNNNLNSNPPGLIGAGTGIGLFPDNGGFKSAIGYTVKNPKVLNFKKIPQIK